MPILKPMHLKRMVAVMPGVRLIPKKNIVSALINGTTGHISRSITLSAILVPLTTSGNLNELILTKDKENYRWEWKSLNGRDGWLVTYLVNNNSIFFPTTSWSPSSGQFWSTTLHSTIGDGNAACCMYLSLNKVCVQLQGRQEGISIRPVSK